MANNMIRSLLFVSGVVLLGAGCGDATTPDQSAFPDPVFDPTAMDAEMAGTTLQSLQQAILNGVNNARRSARNCGSTHYNAVGPVTLDGRLNNAAQGHSSDMVAHNYFSHTGSDGSTPWDRMNDAGYNWHAAGENIAAGYASPSSTITQWLNSPPHCANIMNGSFSNLGVGYAAGGTYRYYWTQDFGHP